MMVRNVAEDGGERPDTEGIVMRDRDVMLT
jgi:hypothetical protein